MPNLTNFFTNIYQLYALQQVHNYSAYDFKHLNNRYDPDKQIINKHYEATRIRKIEFRFTITTNLKPQLRGQPKLYYGVEKSQTEKTLKI